MNTQTNKEVLHTQWSIEKERNDTLHIEDGTGLVIASLYSDPMDDETKANAELIVKAVNNYEKLLNGYIDWISLKDENQKLIEENKRLKNEWTKLNDNVTLNWEQIVKKFSRIIN